MLVLARVCAEVAGISDPAAAARAHDILARTLEQEDLFVVDSGCTETYRVEHVVDGPGLRVDLISPYDRASVFVTAGQEPGTTYRELFHRLRHSVPVTPATAPATQEAVAPASPETVATASPPGPIDEVAAAEPTGTAAPVPRSMFYMRAGFGAVSSFDGGFAFGLGWRMTGEHHGADFSLASVGSAIAVKGELLTVSGNHYAGTGLSVGEVGSVDQSGGAAIELSGGLTLAPKIFVQADLSLPLYSTPAGYPAMFAVSLGFGFGGH